jgi:TonB family protein
MSTAADDFMLEVDRARALAWEWATDPKQQRSFWVGFGLAALVHVFAIVGIGSAPPRTVGSPDGDKNAISVELVDEATLRDSMAPPTPQASPLPPALTPTPPPGAQPTPAAPPPAPAPAETAALEPPTPPVETPPQETPKPPAEATPQEAPKPPEVPALTLQPAEEAAQPPPAEKQKQETKPAEEASKPKQSQPKKKTRTTAVNPNHLDLSVPDMGGSSSDAAGGSSAVQRPPGITKSGENDEFARNVIRALQKSMPYERGARGRVTVRIVLTEDGSRADVTLLKSGGDPDLDFNVMFSARQTAYPFPPNKSTVADRTFMLTYIYR